MARPPFAVAVAAAAVVSLSAQPPATRKQPVRDDYSGKIVVDDYRWLEDGASSEVKAWSDAQNTYARAYLDALPQRKTLFNELTRLYTHPSPRYGNLQFRGGLLFAQVLKPPQEHPALAVLDSPDHPDSARVIVDPARLDPSGGTAIDFYAPSLDGRYVAVSLSKGGSESGDVSVFEVATGKKLSDSIPRVNGGTAGGAVAWVSHGFYYTRYPHSGERPPADLDFYQQIWFHELGTDAAKDRYELGKDFPRIAEITLDGSLDGKNVLARMANGDGGDFAFYLCGPDRTWHQMARFADEIKSAAIGEDGSLYLLSRQNAPMGKVLMVPLSSPDLQHAKTVVPASQVSIQSIVSTRTSLYAVDMAGGPSAVRVFDHEGHPQGDIALGPAASTVLELVPYKGNNVLVQTMSALQPPVWSDFDPGTKKLRPTALAQTSLANFNDCEVLRERVRSKDGTLVPITILRRKGTHLDSNNPVLLYAYGGYGISLSPAFEERVRPLLDRGVVFVVANLRGGGEFGEAWHQGGMLTRKQNVFDDFAASAEWLIAQKYTTASRLAIEGGSNGGLLMGAALTEHPELYAAVVSHVGIYDMLRVELTPNGAFNVTEFGTVKEADQFRALYAYSPYHHVKDGTQYPAILFMTGANDPRVEPYNSRKMTARLQATGTRKPVLLRTSANTGHGIGTGLSERIAEDADALAFLLAQWGLK